MTDEHAPRLHALAIAPPTARSGEVVQITFRTRNHGSRSSGAGVLRFVLPPALEPLGALEHTLPPVAAGAEIVAEVAARIAAALDDRSNLLVTALLEIGGSTFRSNAARVHVRTSARLDGSASGTTVELLDGERVCVRAGVVNEGDGPARDVRLVLRPPSGCVFESESDPVTTALRLEPGASLAADAVARIVAPRAELAADECEVTWAQGGHRLPARAAVPLASSISAPQLELTRGRGRVDVVAEIRNVGWVDATDVPVTLTLPRPLRVIDALVVDGVPYALRAARGAPAVAARVIRAHTPIQLILARVPAREVTRLGFCVACTAGAPPVVIAVSAGARTATACLDVPAIRDVRLRALAVPDWVEPGAEACVTIEVFNAGDAVEDVCLSFAGAEAAAEDIAVTVKPRAIVHSRLQLRIAPAARDSGELLQGRIVAATAAGDCAQLHIALPMRAEVRSASDGVPVRERDAVDWAAPDAVPEHSVEARLSGPPEVACGSALPVRLAIDVRRPLDALELVLPLDATCSYVAGSTTLDGVTLADDAGPPHLVRGLRFRTVAPDTRIVVGWSLLPVVVPADATLAIGVCLLADGEVHDVAPLPVIVRDRQPFAVGFSSTSYVVDAVPAETPVAPLPEHADAPAAIAGVGEQSAALPPVGPETNGAMAAAGVQIALRPDWHDAARRLLQVGDEDGLLRHVLALRALFPDRVSSGEGELTELFDAARAALRETFDRLFVKARIPGFPVAADDVEDTALRAALIALFEGIATAHPAPPRPTEPHEVWARIERSVARESAAILMTAPLGAPAALRAMLPLVPTTSLEDSAAAALRRYVADIDEALRRCTELPLEAFDRALCSGRYPILDVSRQTLLAAMAARASRALPW